MRAREMYGWWLERDKAELAARVASTQHTYNLLQNKDSTYARALKAILDLRVQSLAVFNNAPRTLPAAAPKTKE